MLNRWGLSISIGFICVISPYFLLVKVPREEGTKLSGDPGRPWQQMQVLPHVTLLIMLFHTLVTSPGKSFSYFFKFLQIVLGFCDVQHFRSGLVRSGGDVQPRSWG